MQGGGAAPIFVRVMAQVSRRPPARSREEFLARVREFQGKPVNWDDPKHVIPCLLSKVNAPCHRKLSGEELAEALCAGTMNSQVDSFFTETDVDAQRIFAAEFGVPEDVLLRAARVLAAHTGQKLPLLEEAGEV